MRKAFSETRYFTDSSVMLDMLRANCTSLLDFMGTQVCEIKTKSNPEEEWYWVPTDCKLTDMGICPTVCPEEMGEQSDYQNRIYWIRQPEEEWLVQKTATPSPTEECRKDMMLASRDWPPQQRWPPCRELGLPRSGRSTRPMPAPW
jgi:hypothetical protein